MKKLTLEEFIERSNSVHNNRYDYSLSNYINSSSKIEITCHIHGPFYQRAAHHLSGKGCPKCGGKNFDKNEFLRKSEEIHNDKYNYSYVEYTSSHSKVKILCNKCGDIFLQTPNNHLSGYGCKKCAVESKAKSDRLTKEEFIAKAIDVHNDKYNYSLVNYFNCKTSIDIICKKCGKTFSQIPSSHLYNKTGCKKCYSSSKGEEKIRNYLSYNNVVFEEQKRFKKCKYKNVLSFDFYIPEKDICIEFQGRQHYESVDIFGGEKELNKQKIRDLIKKEFCKNNNITLIEIYKSDSIVDKLSTLLN